MKKPEISTVPGISDKRPPTLKTPQSIVHIKHKITLRQYKYWVLLLQELRAKFEANELPDEDGFFSVSVDQIAEKIGYTPVKTELKSDLSAIRKEPICFNALAKDGQPEYYEAGFISEFKITTKRIRFKFPSFLERVMRGLDEPKAMFALLNWGIFNHFTGKYEAIIYKLCKDYLNSPWKRTPDMTLQEFREYMGLKDGEYSEFTRLGQRVIYEPIKRINESDVSDILVTPELYREGRRVTGLYFKVEHKKQTSLQFPDLEDSIFRFAKVPIPPQLQEKYLSIRPSEEIALCIERANEYGEGQEKAGKTVNYGGLYRKAINEGWHEQQANKKDAEAKRKESRKAEELAKQKQREMEEEKQKTDKDKKAISWDAFNALSEKEKEMVAEEFKAQATTFDLGLYKKKGYDCTPFRIFIKNKFGV